MADKFETLTKKQLIAKLREAEENQDWYGDFFTYCTINSSNTASNAVNYADEEKEKRESNPKA